MYPTFGKIRRGAQRGPIPISTPIPIPVPVPIPIPMSIPLPIPMPVSIPIPVPVPIYQYTNTKITRAGGGGLVTATPCPSPPEPIPIPIPIYQDQYHGQFSCVGAKFCQFVRPLGNFIFGDFVDNPGGRIRFRHGRFFPKPLCFWGLLFDTPEKDENTYEESLKNQSPTNGLGPRSGN